MSRFAGKPVYAASTSEAIRFTKSVIEAALGEARERASGATEDVLAVVAGGGQAGCM